MIMRPWVGDFHVRTLRKILSHSLFVFFVALIIGALLTAWQLYADVGTIDPNGNGSTIQGTQTTCGAGGYFDCVNDGVRSPTAPSTSGDYLQLTNNQVGFFLMSTLSNVSTVSSITVYIHHIEGNANFFHEIGLFAANQTTQYGTLQNVTTYTTAGGRWDSVTFSGLSLTQVQLDDLRIRVACRRNSGNSFCRNHALYAEVTYTQVQNVTVSGGGTQQNIVVGATNAHVGGRFAIVENTASRNVTGITIAEQGTVDAQNHLDNIRLYYDLDTTAPYDCASESYAGTESQFGSTDTDGFSAANGTSAFSGSVAISTTQAMCVYPVLDVTSSATAGQTLELQVTNPSTDVTVSSGVVGPSTAAAIPGTSTLTAPNLTQIRYHWRNDDNNEASATSATGNTEGTAYSSFPKVTTKRLRIEVSNEGTATSNSTAYRLEYAPKVTTCAAATGWTDVGAVGGDWDMSNSTHITDGGNTTNIAVSTGGVTDENTTFVGTGALKDTSSQTSGITLLSTEYLELEYAIQANSSTVAGDTYCFRVSNAGSDIHTYSLYPEATIAADIAVSASGSQVTSIDIPTSNVYIGGRFAIAPVGGSYTLTSITIAASGTVDYQNDLDNIRIYYDLDTSAPYDCASESYGGGESQYGSTDTDGFSGGGTSVFSQSLGITSTQVMCAYVVLDVTSGASNNETLDIKINSPASDVVVTSATVSPSALTSISGMTTLLNDNPTQIRYHWRNDDGSESGATSATGGTEGTPLTNLPKQSRHRLRIEVSNEGGTSTPLIAYRLEYAQKISSCSAATGWTDVGAVGGHWDISASPNITDGGDTTNIAVSSGGVTDENTTFLTPNGGLKDTSSQTSSIRLTSSQYIELEYALAATAASGEGATYCFRVSNAGSVLDTYSLYPEATIKLPDDFLIQRGVSTFTGDTVTLTAGVDYVAPAASTSAFIRITNTHHTGAGDSTAAGNQNADDTTAHIVNPWNITSSVQIGRPTGAAGDTRVGWEIVEYVGPAGGDNEFIVRQQQPVTYGTAATTANTPTVSGVVTDGDIVPFITGQSNPDTGRADYNTGLSTSAWNSGSDTATFTRGEAGGDAVIVSYAVIEFTGANWRIQRSEHTYSLAGSAQTESITAVNSLSRAFVHAQKRVGTGIDTHADFGHEVWLSSVGAVSYQLDSQASTPSGHTSVAWVIENTQTGGTPMVVTRSNGTQSGGTAPVTANINIGKTLDDISVSSLFINNRSSGTSNSYPEPMIAARLISTTQYEIWVSNSGDTRNYRSEVVEWPTAPRRLEQNYYRFYTNTNALDPTDPWPSGGTDLGENTSITGVDDPPAQGEVVRLRMSIEVDSANMPAGVDAFKLQYGQRSTTCSAITQWRDVGSTSSTTALWRGYNNAGVSDGTALSTDPPAGGALNLSVSDVAGTYEEENNSALTPFDAAVGEDVEFDWVLQHNGAVEKTYYCFRMVEAGGSELSTYNFYPTLRTAGYGVQSQNWRWYDDAENTTPTDDLAGENVSPIDIAFDNEIVLRLTLREISGAASNNVKFKLQFSEYSNFSTSTDVVPQWQCTDSSLWCYANGAGSDNATITSALLSDADSCAGGTGVGCGSYNETGTSTSSFRQEAAAATEYSFTIRHAGARVNRVYYFRVYDQAHNELVPLGSGESYPSLQTEGSSLSFTSGGLTAGTATEGVTTDVEATSEGVAFGSLTPGIALEAAQRFDITTNATQGYQLLMYVRGPLTSANGETIAGVTGTNASPLSWASGCAADAQGCFGYHAGDDILDQGSTRFGPNDTYAAFETTPREIAYSAIPVINDVTDLVYKLMVRDQQPAGVYDAEVVFVSVPIF